MRNNILGKYTPMRVKIIDVDFEKRNIYNLGLENNLIVSLLSTVLIHELYGYL